MTDIEIPNPSERSFVYRLLEILPGFLTWSVLILPFVLAFVSPYLLAILIIAYLLAWFIKAIGLNIRVMQSYRTMKRHFGIDWNPLIADLDDTKAAMWRVERAESAEIPEWHRKNLAMRAMQPKDSLLSTEVIHAIIVPTYNEEKEVLEETIKRILDTRFNPKQIVFVLAPEVRGGEEVVANAKKLVAKYKDRFLDALCVPHPPDYADEEIKGKGANATYAGHALQKYLDKKKIDYERVVVTTLDADNRPDPNYLGELTYLYLLTQDRKRTSYQPISLYTNNIWDAPAPMRVLAIGNSFWMMIVSMRPHMLRNFSSHGQGMQSLVDCDFWSRRTIVEDGHQFWRTYFRYDGKHEVYPIFAPIYQDAVLSSTYKRTLKAQFVQLQRWAWGASDVAYVIYTGFLKKNNVPKVDLFQKTMRLIEGHLSWATAPLILAFAALVPVYINPHGREIFVANQLPVIASYIQTIAMAGIILTLFLSVKLLPPRPARYKKHRHIFMFFQWLLMPITSIVYSSFAALNAQTRLMFGRYIGKFNVTEKAVKK